MKIETIFHQSLGGLAIWVQVLHGRWRAPFAQGLNCGNLLGCAMMPQTAAIGAKVALIFSFIPAVVVHVTLVVCNVVPIRTNIAVVFPQVGAISGNVLAVLVDMRGASRRFIPRQIAIVFSQIGAVTAAIASILAQVAMIGPEIGVVPANVAAVTPQVAPILSQVLAVLPNISVVIAVLCPRTCDKKQPNNQYQRYHSRSSHIFSWNFRR